MFILYLHTRQVVFWPKGGSALWDHSGASSPIYDFINSHNHLQLGEGESRGEGITEDQVWGFVGQIWLWYRNSHMTFKEVRKQNLRLDSEERDNRGEALADAATSQESHLLDLRGSLLPGNWQDLMQGLSVIKISRGLRLWSQGRDENRLLFQVSMREPHLLQPQTARSG